LIKEKRQFNGERIVFLISDAGTNSGYPHVKK